MNLVFRVVKQFVRLWFTSWSERWFNVRSAEYPSRWVKRIFYVLLACSIVVADDLGLSEKTLTDAALQYGEDARTRLLNWKSLLNSDRNIGEKQKLKKVNQFFNEMVFVDDIYHWSKTDYWASPVEFLATNGGDCEDFAIAKYFTLIKLGVPESKLRITYVKALRLNQAHMVLTYYKTPSAEPLVLDNLVTVIQPASLRQDLAPVYSFNGDGLWLAKQRGLGKKLGKSSKLNMWRDLRRRMKQQSAQ